jgi:hypothetical protein
MAQVVPIVHDASVSSSDGSQYSSIVQKGTPAGITPLS